MFSITETTVDKLYHGDRGLLAVCSVSLGAHLTIHDIKVVKLSDGEAVIMPARKLTAHCLQCGSSNYLKSKFCSNCGRPFKHDRQANSLSQDIVRPSPALKDAIRKAVLEEYRSTAKSH